MTNPLLPNQNQVVFMGDSITKEWYDSSPEFFTENQYVAQGKNGQTTSEMLIRFKTDVIDLQPKAVVILAGTNDIAGNRGSVTNEFIQGNLKSMAEMAQANEIKVILSSILPASDYPWRKGLHPAQRIISINTWIKKYCEDNNLVYLDYWTQMADEKNGLKDEFTYDGVHVTKAGYELMQTLIQPIIVNTLFD